MIHSRTRTGHGTGRPSPKPPSRTLRTLCQPPPGGAIPQHAEDHRHANLLPPLSGHSHRVRLFLSLIGAHAEAIEVDLANGAHKAPEFLKLNPFGQVPVLVDNDIVITDSNAILVYLAKRFGKTDWLPESPAGAAAVQKWLSVAAGEIAYGPAAARPSPCSAPLQRQGSDCPRARHPQAC